MKPPAAGVKVKLCGITNAEDAKAAAGLKRLNFVAERLNEDCLGADFCVADAYLLMILMWLARTTFSLRDLCPA